MTLHQQIKENNLTKDDNIINLEDARKSLQTGGSDGTENWLSEIPVGSVFLARRKGSIPNMPKDVTVPLDMYCVLEHKEWTTNLMQKIPDGRQAELWFETLEFSRKNNLVEIIAHVEFTYEKPEDALLEKQEEVETEDGDSDRPV